MQRVHDDIAVSDYGEAMEEERDLYQGHPQMKYSG